MPLTETRNIAFLIGIGDYQSVPTLATPERDVTAISTLLSEQHQYHTITCLNPGVQALRNFLSCDNLTRSIREINASSDDQYSVVIYFAGHGFAEESDTGIKGYLIPADGQRGDRHTWFDMADLVEAMNALPVKHLLLVLDCCFGGSIRWASKYRQVGFAPERLLKSHYHYYSSRRSSQVLTSTAPDQSALDLLGHGEKEGHSPFAYCLLQALSGHADTNGDRVITLAELYAWMQFKVLALTRQMNHVQNIGLYPLENHDQGEYLFPLAGFNPDALTAEDLTNPYRGLESYEPENSHLFFGRSAAINALETWVARHALTVVVGASGTGKSSLVKAGIVPRLRGKTAIITPGRKPLESLRQAGDFDTLVIDQFEHLVTQSETGESDAFFQALLALYQAGKRLLLTVRIDYENQLTIPPGLHDAWQTGRFLVPPFSAEELREVIITPALRVGRFIEPPTLVDTIISEVIHFPGSLPLLSFTMRELFEKSKRQHGAWYSIEAADYLALGGVIGALQKRADYVFEQPLPTTNLSSFSVESTPKTIKSHQNTLRNLLLRMVSLTGGETSGRRVLREVLVFDDPAETSRMNTIIDRLLEERLVRSDKDSENKYFIEPAHDALVRSWKMMQEWIGTFTEANILLVEKLHTAVLDYQDHGQKQEYLWHENPNLEPLESVIQSPEAAVMLTRAENQFVQNSRRLKNRNKRNRVIQVATAFVLLTVLALFGFYQAGESKKNANTANQNAQEAREQGARANMERDTALAERRKSDSLRRVAQQALEQRIAAEENRRREQVKTFTAQGNEARSKQEYATAMLAYQNALSLADTSEKAGVQKLIEVVRQEKSQYDYDKARTTGLQLVALREYKLALEFLEKAYSYKKDDPDINAAILQCKQHQ